MSRKRNLKSQAGRHAFKVAGALAKGRLPPPSPELEDFVGGDDRAIFETLEGLVAHAASQDEQNYGDDDLTHGYLYLLGRQLENLRFQTDRGYDAAIGLVDEFQRAVADHVGAGRLGGTLLSMVSSALHQAQIPVSAELKAALQDSLEAPRELRGLGQLSELLDSIVDGCEGDPFQITSMLTETAHGLPPELRCGMAATLALSPNDITREAAVLMLLDPAPYVRGAVIAALESKPASVSPVSLRRLIAMRNWRPQAERGKIDEVVRAVRAKGTECASAEPSRAEEFFASGIDGSGAQTGLVVSSAGRRKQLSSILLKHGLRDAMTGAPQTGRELTQTLAQAADDVVLLAVSRRYLDQAICHHLQVGIDAGMLPPGDLLQVAERIGGADWQPSRLDWREILAALLAATPEARLEPAAVAKVLVDSDRWAALPGLVESWFEDDQDVARLVGASGRRMTEKQIDYLLDTVIERRREKWAELFLWIALWLREGAEGAAPWQEFAILADAIAKGHDLGRIPLMRMIAMTTVVALRGAA